MKNSAMIWAAVFGFLGVALGAFGAHALEVILTQNERVDTWHTAVLYQFVHVGFLLVLGILRRSPENGNLLKWATGMAVAGILIFSGSLYALSLSNIKKLGAITPIGGLCFLIAWAILLLYSFQKNSSNNDTI